MTSLAGLRLLVVEDDFFIADDLARDLRASGAEVVGPVSNVDSALKLLGATAQLDGAVLDINLQGELAFAVADQLLERKVAFVFATGYDADPIPHR
jgi:CheY-like chemotaxis protein